MSNRDRAEEIKARKAAKRKSKPKPAPRVPTLQRDSAPWRGDMIPRATGWGYGIKWPHMSVNSREIQWVSREKDAQGLAKITRVPEESSRTFSRLEGGFDAAGKHYERWGQLVDQFDETRTICKDIYGRDVFFCAERYPCFDAFDAMHENRFYRWFFLREGAKLTRIYVDDGDYAYTLTVTEDVREIEDSCWMKMQQYGWFKEQL